MPTSKNKKPGKKISSLVKEFNEKINVLLDELRKEEKKKNESIIEEYLPELFNKISKDYGIPEEELYSKYARLIIS